MGEWDAPHLEAVDASIMPLVDMCNIACGGHAGSREILMQTIELAKTHQTKVGAHPGFEDRANFGRSYQDIPAENLLDSIEKQLDLFLEACSQLNVVPSHVKAHGALYHACNHKQKEAEVLIEAMLKTGEELHLLVGPNSLLEKLAAENGINTMTESFIDRMYNDDLSLVSRLEDDAVILDPEKALTQFRNLREGQVWTRSGIQKSLITNTACIHGDNTRCLDILTLIQSHG